jgi:hypothetical protein
LAQETHSPWTKLFPIALIRLRNTPGKQGLTPFESLYGRPFLTNDLLLDQQTAQLISQVTQLAKFQQTLSEIKQATPREDIKGLPVFCPGDLVLIVSKSNPGFKHPALGGASSSYFVHSDTASGRSGFLDPSLKSQGLEFLCGRHISTSRPRSGACLLLM